MESPAASSSPDPTPPQDLASPTPPKRSAWKHPAPNGVVDAPAPTPAPAPAPAVMDANHWPALSEAAKKTKLSSDSARPPESSTAPSPAPVAASSAPANSSNPHKHASGTHHGRHKPARRAGAGDHSPRDHPDRTPGGWDHATGGGGGRGGQRNHNNGGGWRGNATSGSATGISHHGAAPGGGFGGGRRRGGYEPFYRGPPPMGMAPYMRGAPPPPPPMTVPPPFMGPPPPPVSPMRPFAGPMVYHDMQSPVSPVSPIYFYGPPPPPEALRGLALAPHMVGPPAYPYFQALSEPQPEPEAEPEPVPAEEERAKLLNQIEFYFSKENLCSDVYLRQQMDGQGWVDISLIAGFKKVQELTNDLQYIKETVQSSSILEMQGDKIRKQNDWEKWVIPHESNPGTRSSSASVPRPNVNNLTAHLGGMGLHESASSSSSREQNHDDAIQNGSPSGNDEAAVVEDNSGHQ